MRPARRAGPAAPRPAAPAATGVMESPRKSSDPGRLVLQLRRWPWWRASAPCSTANLPITRAVATWLLPLAMSSGRSDVPSKRSPIGAYTNRSKACSTACSIGVFSVGVAHTSTLWCAALHAVGAELALGVGELRGVLHEEAGLAHELAGALRLDPAGAVAPLLGLGRHLLLVLLLLGGGDPVLQDGVEVGLDVVGVVLLLLLVLALVVVPLGLDRGRRVVVLVLLVVVEDRVVVLGVEVELVDGQVVVVEVVLVEGVVIEVDGLLSRSSRSSSSSSSMGSSSSSAMQSSVSGGSGGGRGGTISRWWSTPARAVRHGAVSFGGRSQPTGQQTPTMRGYGFTAAPPPGWTSKCTCGGPPAALPVVPT